MTSVQSRPGAELGTGPVSTEPYISEEYFALERDRIFGTQWLNLARVEELPRRRDFVVRDIEAAGASILVVHGDDGVVRAFHNVCSHRSNPVTTLRSGSAANFRCAYHGWTYGTDGSLRAVTARERFGDLDVAACGLTPVHCDVWQGFVFVNLDTTTPPPLRTFLGGWADAAEGYPFELGDAPVTMATTVDANWKVALDAFQETYHLGYLHRTTMRNMYFTATDHSGSFLSYDLFGPHRRYSVWANPDYSTPEHARVERLVGRLARNINAGSQGGRTAWHENCPGVNPTRAANWCWDNSFVFPNLVITFAPEIWILSRFWPLSVNRTRWENVTYYPTPATASERFAREFGFCHLRDVAAEDVATMEGSTRGLASRAKPTMQLQDYELGIRHMLGTVEALVRPDPRRSRG